MHIGWTERRWVAVVLALSAAAHAVPLDDGHQPAWLDDSKGAKALGWVASEDTRTLKTLSADPRFKILEGEAQRVLTDPGRLESTSTIGPDVYQYHQEHDHPLGIWRRTAKDAYLAGKPAWETVIDLDALAAKDHKKWFFEGASCHGRHCLVRLSNNGKDAVETRELSLDTRQFVAGGFVIPDSKSRAWWYDDDTLLVSPVLGPDSINVSLEPKTVRVWKRGTPLAAAAQVFSIADKDAGLSVSFIKAAGTDKFVVARHPDFVRREYWLMGIDGSSQPLGLPEEAQSLGVFSGKLLARLDADWSPPGAGQIFHAGSIVALSLEMLMKEARIAGVELVYTPGGDDAVRGITSGDGRLFVELLHDYYSSLIELKPAVAGEPWSKRAVPLSAARFRSMMGVQQGRLLMREEAPLVPESVVLADPDSGAEQALYSRPAAFDASGLTTELFHAQSADGTRIDYTINHPKDMRLDGGNPTLVYGYGGYDVPVTPRYEPVFGKLWMERGGVYVHAYLRGGGEHSEPWHRGTMKSGHTKTFQDMEAVLQDLQKRGVTSPAHTGIMGRSNGGLMVATVMERSPGLLNAVVVGGPLIDMLNFQHLPPGGTWLAEYGDPDIPEQEAFLRTYSPMQNISAGGARYPVPLIITATDDDRVLPGHARRFAYQLRLKGHDRLYYEDQQGGHYWELGGGPIAGDWRLRAKARAVEFTYLWERLGNPGK